LGSRVHARLDRAAGGLGRGVDDGAALPVGHAPLGRGRDEAACKPRASRAADGS
jgi:hypothetical protein